MKKNRQVNKYEIKYFVYLNLFFEKFSNIYFLAMKNTKHHDKYYTLNYLLNKALRRM